MAPPITDRQREILRVVVEEYVATGQPVGSRTLVERSGLNVSPSTVRSELAELERFALLTHPHPSAGRVPTEDGYRLYADALLALQATTEALSQVTKLLALVSAPPLESATVRHVEVLRLQANVAMAVVITSTGTVAKQRVAFAEPVD